VAEYVAEAIGWFSMSVLLVKTTHATEVRHEMLQCAGVMRWQGTQQRIQSRLAVLN